MGLTADHLMLTIGDFPQAFDSKSAMAVLLKEEEKPRCMSGEFANDHAKVEHSSHPPLDSMHNDLLQSNATIVKCCYKPDELTLARLTWCITVAKAIYIRLPFISLQWLRMVQVCLS
uniref:Uncharacterized protein n=1 Tax=Glossina pallidipes TaxID=7398 RepID=A0A1A9ZL10_GLOPL